MTFPPVAWADTENMSSPFWGNLRRSSVDVYGSVDTCIIVESYKKQYPTRDVLSPEMLHFNTDALPASWRVVQYGGDKNFLYGRVSAISLS